MTDSLTPAPLPIGWQTVPTEITEEMHTAAVRTAVRCTGNDDFPPRVYRAMLAAAPKPAAEPARWRDMATAPKDGTLLRLLVDFEDHATEDGEGPQPTIGSNTWDNHHDFDEWQFAGWNWEQDCYTQGVGTPVGWLPMLDEAATPPAVMPAAPSDAGESK